ncbi:MAG: hypothetical protein ACTTJ3_07205 [Treponema sp.]
MRKAPLIMFLCFIYIFSLKRVDALCLPAYPFEFSYSIYSGENKGDVTNLLRINAGIRLETMKAMYFDIFFKGDLILHMSKQKGLYADLLQKDIQDFLNASVNFPSILGKRISLSLFFGKYDELGSDSILREHLKSSASASLFMRSYPANVFRPNLNISGVGLALYGASSNGFYTGFYSHWNTKIGEELTYTNDLRFGFSYSSFSFESFIGFLAKKQAKDFRMRLGLMGSIHIEEYELFFEMGFARLALQDLSFENLHSQFYVLFEPRITRPLFNVAISFFMSSPFQLPNDLESKELRATNFIGFNLLLGLGNLEEHRINGGFSLLTSVNLLNFTEVTPFTFSIGPFITTKVGEVELKLKVPFNPLMYADLRRAVMAEVSVKAVY